MRILWIKDTLKLLSLLWVLLGAVLQIWGSKETNQLLIQLRHWKRKCGINVQPRYWNTWISLPDGFFLAVPVIVVHFCSQSCDLWSLGVIIYVMLCGYPPFYSKHHSRTIPKDMRKKIMTGSFDFPEDEWSQISEMAKDIVRKWVRKATEVYNFYLLVHGCRRSSLT